MDVGTEGSVARLRPPLTRADQILEAYIDLKFANEAITNLLESGAEGVVHIAQARAGPSSRTKTRVTLPT